MLHLFRQRSAPRREASQREAIQAKQEVTDHLDESERQLAWLEAQIAVIQHRDVPFNDSPSKE